jgi:surfactin synthase thioesterase subunit
MPALVTRRNIAANLSITISDPTRGNESSMKSFALTILAALAGATYGCAATVETAAADSNARAPKESYVTGSRLPRSESNENFQGAKSMSRQDYQEYKSSTTLSGGT